MHIRWHVTCPVISISLIYEIILKGKKEEKWNIKKFGSKKMTKHLPSLVKVSACKFIVLN